MITALNALHVTFNASRQKWSVHECWQTIPCATTWYTDEHVEPQNTKVIISYHVFNMIWLGVVQQCICWPLRLFTLLPQTRADPRETLHLWSARAQDQWISTSGGANPPAASHLPRFWTHPRGLGYLVGTRAQEQMFSSPNAISSTWRNHGAGISPVHQWIPVVPHKAVAEVSKIGNL